MAKLVHPELSYKVVGVLYNVNKELGAGLQEKYYQRAIRLHFQKQGIPFTEQARVEVEVCGRSVGRYFLDFVIDQKIVLEIKARAKFYRQDTHQVLAYLKKSGLELGLLAKFSDNGVDVRRILRGNPSPLEC